MMLLQATDRVLAVMAPLVQLLPLLLTLLAKADAVDAVCHRLVLQDLLDLMDLQEMTALLAMLERMGLLELLHLSVNNNTVAAKSADKLKQDHPANQDQRDNLERLALLAKQPMEACEDRLDHLGLLENLGLMDILERLVNLESPELSEPYLEKLAHLDLRDQLDKKDPKDLPEKTESQEALGLKERREKMVTLDRQASQEVKDSPALKEIKVTVEVATTVLHHEQLLVTKLWSIYSQLSLNLPSFVFFCFGGIPSTGLPAVKSVKSVPKLFLISRPSWLLLI